MATTQLLWFAIGLSAMVLLAGRFRDDGILRHYKYTWALAGTLLLVITFLFGREVNGARLWIFLGPIGFQPGRGDQDRAGHLHRGLPGREADAAGAAPAPASVRSRSRRCPTCCR